MWIGPETDHGETGTITGFGSIILADPLRSAHAAGEQILNLDGLSPPGGPPPAGGPGAPPGSVRPPGSGAAPGAAGGSGGSLARTGTSAPADLAPVGALCLAVGALLLVLARRRGVRCRPSTPVGRVATSPSADRPRSSARSSTPD